MKIIWALIVIAILTMGSARADVILSDGAGGYIVSEDNGDIDVYTQNGNGWMVF